MLYILPMIFGIAARRAALAFLGISVALAAYVLTFRGELTRLPVAESLPLFFPYASAMDSEGNGYVVDTAQRRIVALDKEGRLRWVKTGGRRSGGFFYAANLAVDGQNRLYVYNKIPYQGLGFNTEEIQVLRYSKSGAFERVVFSEKNQASSDSYPGFFSIFVRADRLYYLSGDGHNLNLFSTDLDGGGRIPIRSLPTSLDFVAVAALPNGSLCAAVRDGSVWQAEPGASWTLLPIPTAPKPWDLRYDEKGRLLLLDLLKGELLRLEPDGKTDILLSTRRTGGVFADSFAISPKGALVVADKERQALIVAEEGGEPKVFKGARYSEATLAFRWSVWLGLVLALLSLVAAVLSFFLGVMRGRHPLLLVQIVFFVPVIIASQYVAFNQVGDTLARRYRAEVKNTLLNAASLTARLLPLEDVQALAVPSDLASPAYARVRAAAEGLLKEGERTGAFAYLALYRQIGGQPYYVYTGSGTFGVDYPYTLLPPAAKELFSKPGRIFEEYLDDYGMYEAAFASLDRADGSQAGIVEVGLFSDLVREVDDAYLASARAFAFASALASVIVFIMLNFFMMRSLDRLRRMTRQIAGGDLALHTGIQSRDEIGQLSRSFVQMANRLQTYVDDITDLTKASARFVPADFIDLLGVEDLTELRLGDQTRREICVLFSTVGNFRKVTSNHSSQGVFNFLNSYLGLVVPPIRLLRGLIDKYMGDTYMALFPGSPQDAFRSVRAIRKRLRLYNAKRLAAGSEELTVTFGIHRGPLMLGIVGESERMEGTVISDAVNLASRLNGLCRIYRVPCIATISTLQAPVEGEGSGAADVPRAPVRPRDPFRRLDHVIVKGKSEPLLICEPIDPEDPAGAALMALLPDYEEAFAIWERGDLEEASRRFDSLHSRLPEDPVITRHADRCRHLLESGKPSPWTPAVSFDEK